MTHHDQRLLRLAIAIDARGRTEQGKATRAELPTATWLQCERTLRLICAAQRHGWHLAARRLIRDLRGSLLRLRGDLMAFECELEPQEHESFASSVRDIHADLVTLSNEFDGIAFDQRKRTISVTTEPIELDGVYLGPFEIQLDWGDLTGGHPDNYRVIALDAHPAATNDSVTHPHVQDDAVCEGDGRQMIRSALEQGRLLDFFVIVANLLRTYNSGSPYVALSDWGGAECADCGGTMSDDGRWTCEKCETTVCGRCYQNCSDCDGIYCDECTTSCGGCDETRCRSCVAVCSVCHGEFCQGCINDDERCFNCHDKENDSTEACDSSEYRDAQATIQSGRVGEAVVPA